MLFRSTGTQGTLGTQGASGPSTTINATAVTTNSTFYPVFVAAAGSNQTASIRTTSQALSFNANSSTLTSRIVVGTGYGSLGDYGGLFGQIRVGADVYGNTIKVVNDTNLNITANNGIYFNTGAATDGSTTGTSRCLVDSSGHFKPNVDNTYNLGTSSNRWANVYSADLQLSNEGIVNDVDGTWGKYTIQEGENDLFLINRRTGKKYKFLLEEVK